MGLERLLKALGLIGLLGRVVGGDYSTSYLEAHGDLVSRLTMDNNGLQGLLTSPHDPPNTCSLTLNPKPES